MDLDQKESRLSVLRREEGDYLAILGRKETVMIITLRVGVGLQWESRYDDQAAGFQEVSGLHFEFWAQKNLRHARTHAPSFIFIIKE